MRDDSRPSPEELLNRYSLLTEEPESRRGKLRVLLGSAPGVGKTYAMLNEGRRLQAQGVDVVAGFVETHGREETERQIGDLEIVPIRQIEYRGKALSDMDTEAIIERAPTVVLVDELAHTNVPGSHFKKRYEDVEALRNVGIDVITTLNVQHLESLNDIVESVTGVRVRETLPDRIVDEADEVQLVDLSVEALMDRLEQGKIYPEARAQQALRSYFRAGNLTALRELALRTTAADVEDRLSGYMRDNEIETVWPAAVQIVVLLYLDDSAGLVLRNAWRLASAFRGDLSALMMLPPGGEAALSGAEAASLDEIRRLAEDLGVALQIETGTDMPKTVARRITELNAHMLVMSYSPTAGWRRFFSTNPVDQILNLVSNVDIYLVETNEKQ